MTDLTDPTFWITTFIYVLALLISYLDMRRRVKESEIESETLKTLIKKEEQASQSTFALLELYRQEMKALREEIPKQKQSSDELKRQELLQRQQELEYKKTKDLWTAVGKFYDTIREDD